LDLPVWQQLFDSLNNNNFMIVAVAEDSDPEAARPWIEQAKPSYWSLVDTEHRVSALYGMVNVPTAVWIDEAGRIARPPETAGSTDHFRRMDLKTRSLKPEDAAARQKAREFYIDAVRQWVTSGVNALDADDARERLPRVTRDMVLAHTHFRLGAWLARNGRAEEGARHMAEASRLHPDSWCMWRQAADKTELGLAGGPDFWARVRALGDKPYYRPPDLPGYPSG
jgi:hypothetical protein